MHGNFLVVSEASPQRLSAQDFVAVRCNSQNVILLCAAAALDQVMSC